MASWRHIFFLLSLLGLFSAGVIFGMLFWLTARVESIEHEKTIALIDLKMSETSDALTFAVEDHAYWTLAHDLVEASDDAGILEHIGSSATESQLFDQLFILGPDGDLLHAFDESLGAQAQGLFDEDVFRPVWIALNQTEAIDYQSVTSVLDHQGEFAIVVAAWITPDRVADLPDARFATLVGVIHLGERKLEALIKDAHVSTAVVTSYSSDSSDVSNDDRLTLYDINRAPVASLTWTMPSAGAALRQDLYPSVVLAVLIILGICGLVARYFRSQYGSLEQANIVATTDQLTGLLNRAGLQERLGSKGFIQSLQKGHLAAIYLDLNKFKTLNDNLGHMAGDLALRVTAERLKSAARKSDIVARLGGDEFVCVVIDVDPESAAVGVARRILELSEAPISFGSHEQVVKPSVGLSVSTPGTQWQTVLSQSDAAMYWSKQKNADYPIVFSKSMDAGNNG